MKSTTSAIHPATAVGRTVVVNDRQREGQKDSNDERNKRRQSKAHTDQVTFSERLEKETATLNVDSLLHAVRQDNDHMYAQLSNHNAEPPNPAHQEELIMRAAAARLAMHYAPQPSTLSIPNETIRQQA